jgi:hypothetical protein
MIPDLPGAHQIVEWWGRWIDFHDFYILNLPAVGESSADIRIHGWITDPEKLDENGCWTQSDHCVVTFQLRGIRRVEFWNPDNLEPPIIIMDLEIRQLASGWILAWTSSYGPEGEIEADDVSIQLTPGEP